jgi:2-keto-4-pentenoate hydratase
MARIERAEVRDARGVVRAGDVVQAGAVGRAMPVAVQVRVDWPVRQPLIGRVKCVLTREGCCDLRPFRL